MINYADTYNHLYANGYGDGPFRKLWKWKTTVAKRILDVGCGRCGLAELVSPDVELYGIDVSQEAIGAVGNRRKRYTDVQILALSLDRGTIKAEWPEMDLVFCADVLEHIAPEDVDRFWGNAISFLKHGGQALVSICLCESEWKDQQGGGLHLSLRSHEDWTNWFSKNVGLEEVKFGTHDIWMLGKKR